MRALVVWALVLALPTAGFPAPAPAASIAAEQAAGRLAGVVLDQSRKPVPDRCVRARRLDSNEVVARTTTSDKGEFEFTNLPAGVHVVEVLDRDCNPAAVVATSSAISMSAPAGVVTGVEIVLGGTGGLGAFFTSTAGVLLLVAGGAGITAAAIASRTPASPVR